jgi:type II secretory pathway pseudopilin PulG
MDSMAPHTRPGEVPARGLVVVRSRGGRAFHGQTTRQRGQTAEAGFTLAAVIVIMTIMMIFVAYTVPRQWSTVMKREREQETIFAMQQYAKAITEFRLKNNTYPTSPKQLQDARSPRMIRGPKGEFTDPLTGEVDWLVIPQSAAGALPQRGLPGQNNPPGSGPVPSPSPSPSPAPTTTDTSGTTGTATSTSGTTDTSTTSTNPQAPKGLPGIPIKDYAGGPFIGVRPPAHGKSLISFFDADTYETWVYTTIDYDREKQLRIAAAGTIFH